MKKRLKKIAIVVGILFLGLFTLYALWATWENWTGARAWKEVRTMLEEEEIELEIAKLIPQPVPAEDNFCATPLLASLADFEWNQATDLDSILNDSSEPVYANAELRERVLAIKLPDPEVGQPKALPHWQSATRADLETLRSRLPGASAGEVSILEWMAQFEAELAEIDAAARRPEAQMLVRFSENFLENVSMPMPYLMELMDLQKFLAIRACASLEASDRGQAIASLRDMFQLSRASASHPTLIGFLVGQTTMEICLSVVWHGIDANQWSAKDLKWIQEQLSGDVSLERLERALTTEMVLFQIGASDFLKSVSLGDSMDLVSLIGPIGGASEPSSAGILAVLAPSGIWDHNKAFGCRVACEHGILPVRERRIPNSDALLDELKTLTHRNFLAGLTIPATTNITKKGFHLSVAIDLARLACAVERYQMEHGDYPDSLDSLTPAFINEIPEDLFAPGNPLIYAKGLHGDRYRIYSVGKNLDDDDGTAVFQDKPRDRPRRNLDEGDWVWGYSFKIPAEETLQAEPSQ